MVNGLCIDWRKVAQDKSLSNEFAVEVKNRFQVLFPEIEQDHIDDSYSSLSKITEQVATDMLPKKSKRSIHQPSISFIVEQARNKLKLISADYHRSPSALKKVSLELAKRALDEAYHQLKLTS